MSALKKTKLLFLLLVVAALCLALIPPVSLASGTQESDTANHLFVYADDAGGNQVLLKVIPLSTLKSMSHGSDGTANTNYYASFIDAYPTPTYCEGRGVTIPELLDYVLDHTSVTGAGSLTYAGMDKLYFTCCDGASVNFTYDELLGVNRYYYPALYDNWNAADNVVKNVDTILASCTSAPPYLATVSAGGRVFASAGGNNISSYVTENGGVVNGCLSGVLNDEEALRFVTPQTETQIRNSTPTYSDIKKWVYKVRLKTDAASPITSLGTVSNPTCTYTLDGTTLTITMSCADKNAAIYYSTIGGATTTPVNLYTGPITVGNYDVSKPFTLGLTAVREGYASSSVVTKSSADYSDSEDAPGFVYALAASGTTSEVGTAFSLAATLTADKDYTLYGGEYRVSVPSAFTVDSVRAGDGWQYGKVSGDDETTIVTFAHLSTAGTALTANTAVPVGSITLTPASAGTATIAVSAAIVTKNDASAYTKMTADDLGLTVTGSNAMLGDVNEDGYVTIADILRVCKAVNNTITLTDDQKKAADVNKDGYVTVADILRMCKYVNKVISQF